MLMLLMLNVMFTAKEVFEIAVEEMKRAAI